MVKVNYDSEYNTVIVEFKGNIDAVQAEQFFPGHRKGHPETRKRLQADDRFFFSGGYGPRSPARDQKGNEAFHCARCYRNSPGASQP